MNVAITRGKHFLFVVGNANTLRRDQTWKDLVDYAKERVPNGYYACDSRNDYELQDLKSAFLNSNPLQAQVSAGKD